MISGTPCLRQTEDDLELTILLSSPPSAGISGMPHLSIGFKGRSWLGDKVFGTRNVKKTLVHVSLDNDKNKCFSSKLGLLSLSQMEQFQDG